MDHSKVHRLKNFQIKNMETSNNPNEIIDEVFCFYDRPIIYTYKTLEGDLFLRYLCCELEKADLWIDVPVSTDCYPILENDISSIRDIILNAPYVFYVLEDFDDKEYKILIEPKDIPEEYLPEADIV